MAPIDLEHVHFRYPDGFEALRGVDLHIGAGEKVALVGPNGAGKSTLMLQLNGTLRPAHGSVRVAGLAVAKDTIRRVRAEVGLVFQDPDDQLFSPTVFDDVAFGPLHMGLPADEVHRRVERALAAVGMAAFAHRVPHRMSLGQRKRVALATVLSMDPSILVFDEPSAGLDPRGRRELIRLLRSLDQTMLVSTHDMRLVAEVFPRTVVMDDGLVVADGPTGDDPGRRGAPRGARARGPVGRRPSRRSADPVDRRHLERRQAVRPAEQPRDERRNPPAQEVEPAADADARDGEQRSAGRRPRRSAASPRPAGPRRTRASRARGTCRRAPGRNGAGTRARAPWGRDGAPSGRAARRARAGTGGCRTRPRRAG